MKTPNLKGEHRLTLEGIDYTLEAIVNHVDIKGEADMFDEYVPATITVTIVPQEGYLYKMVAKKLMARKSVAIDVDVAPNISEILSIKEVLGLPPEAMGTYEPDNKMIVYRWEEEV